MPALTNQTASCRCGQLRAACIGEPVRVSVCHCLDCQKRSGSAFAAQVRFPAEAVAITGTSREFRTANDKGITRFHFCGECGTTPFYLHDHAPETIAIALGAFDDPHAFTPDFSVWESRKHDWVAISGDSVEHD